MDEPSPGAAKPEGPAGVSGEDVPAADGPALAPSTPGVESEGSPPEAAGVAAEGAPSTPSASETEAAAGEGPASAASAAEVAAAGAEDLPSPAGVASAPEAERGAATESPRPGVRFGAAGRYALPIVAGLALLETAAHLYQTRPVDEAGDYRRAAEYVRGQIAATDGLAFYPDWSSRQGRMHFQELATLEREGPSDLTRYPRLYAVRNRGASGGPPGWRVAASRDFGIVAVDTLENPKPEPVLWSALTAFERASSPSREAKVEAFVHGPTEHRPCPWVEDRGTALPWDPAVPPHRFQCENVGVGPVVTQEHEFRPRYCVAATPMVAPRAVRVRFKDVPFGKKIVVHHMIQKSFENPKYAPVSARYWAELAEERMAERTIGTTVFRDGPGFTEVTFETPDLATKTGVLAVDIQAASQEARHYCFEVTTR